MQREFSLVFQISKLIMFEVKYYVLGDNSFPYFTTSANKFCRNKQDYSIAGQAQKELLPQNSLAFKFWSKWDIHHLRILTNEKLEELLIDLEPLKNNYNYLEKVRPLGSSYWNAEFRFSELVEFSKQPLKATHKITIKENNNG